MVNIDRKFLNMLKNQQQTGSKRAIQKTAEATDDLIDNKITNKIIKVSKNSQQNNSETATNDYDK